MRYSVIFLVGLTLLLQACESDYTPRPKGYFKIDLPDREYAQYSKEGCPFSFEVPGYANVTTDPNDVNNENPCWLLVEFPELKATIYLSYKPIEGEGSFRKMVEETYKLTSKHMVKAAAIDERIIKTTNNVSGLMYEVAGDAASALQFYLTDSTDHFVRCSMYFYATPNEDSIRPVSEFVKQDAMHLIETFKWVPDA